jgi:hypothetical protein
MRPLYESQSDLQNEFAVAALLAKRWSCEFRKLPIKYGVDFAVCQGRDIVAFAEIKCRSYSYSQLDRLGGYMVSAHKWAVGLTLSRSFDVPLVLIVRLTDGIFWTKDTSGKLVMGGRSDRGDEQDIEPCVLLPMSSFRG